MCDPSSRITFPRQFRSRIASTLPHPSRARTRALLSQHSSSRRSRSRESRIAPMRSRPDRASRCSASARIVFTAIGVLGGCPKQHRRPTIRSTRSPRKRGSGLTAALGCTEQHEFGTESQSESAARALWRQQRAGRNSRFCLQHRFAAPFRSRSVSPQRRSCIFCRGAFARRAASFISASDGRVHRNATCVALFTHRGAVASIVVTSTCTRSERSVAQQCAGSDSQKRSAFARGTARALGCREQYEFGTESQSLPTARARGRQRRSGLVHRGCLQQRSAASSCSARNAPHVAGCTVGRGAFARRAASFIGASEGHVHQ